MLRNNILTGEKIQELTNHTIVCHGQFFVDEQLKHTNCKYTYFDPNKDISSLPSEILEAKSLFVYTHILDFFFEKIFPLLTNEFILVSHNSDSCVSEKYTKYLNDSKIKKWFGQNIEIVHNKLVALPIGIANSQWPHGDLNILQQVINEKHEKRFPVNKNFDINTAPTRRNHVDSATTLNGILMTPRKSYIDYLRDIAQSYFSICPMGNGIDCHRVWESLYLNCIPIVADCIHYRDMKELPMIAVVEGETRNWEFITFENLDKFYTKFKNNGIVNIQKTDLNYWKDRIQKGE